MDKLRIVYATKTKHSRMLAEAIGRALHVQPENAADKPALRDTDTLFLVGGVYGGYSLPEMMAYVNGLHAGSVRRVVLVTTSASGTMRQLAVRRALAARGIPVAREIILYGSLFLLRLGHPNRMDTGYAVDFARELAV